MNWYLVYSGGLHALAVLCVILLMAPGSKKPSATYTIDFIGTGKVQAVTAPQTATKSPAPAAAQEPVSKPEVQNRLKKPMFPNRRFPPKKKLKNKRSL